MSKVKIDIISRVHIGSGEKLQYGSDFINFREDGVNYIGIVSPRKIISLIGNSPQAVEAWIAAIERKKSVIDFMKAYASKAIIDDYCSRIDQNSAAIKNTDTLQTFIHDGLGRPYIPGSSLKGSIRTAILATLVNGSNGIDGMIDRNPRKVNAKSIECHCLGNNPNEDAFRFLQVGDAYFGECYENVVQLVNINERKQHSYWDISKPQLVEILTSGDSSTCEIRIDRRGYELARNSVHALPSCMTSLRNIFTTVNRHTKKLLTEEIDYWQERVNKPNADRVDDYLDRLRDVMDKIQICEKSNGNSCLLRLGAGSGWRFITGGWTEGLECFDRTVVPAARRNNDRYVEYNFPKSRRVDNWCKLLGFVRLTLLED